MQIYASKSLTKPQMKLKLASLESGSPPLSNDAISVQGRSVTFLTGGGGGGGGGVTSKFTDDHVALAKESRPMASFSCQLLTHVLCLVGLKISLLLSLRIARNKSVEENMGI
jgi:hypothetical protein